MKASYRSVVAAALVVSAGALRARAREPVAPVARPIAHRSVSRRAQLSMDQVVRLVQRQLRARVVRVETQTQGSRTIYVLRMLDDTGRVFAVRVDAASGAIL